MPQWSNKKIKLFIRISFACTFLYIRNYYWLKTYLQEFVYDVPWEWTLHRIMFHIGIFMLVVVLQYYWGIIILKKLYRMIF